MSDVDKHRDSLVFMKHPDGSLSQGAPPGYQESTPPGTPRLWPFDASQLVNTDIVFILARHETLFLLLLLTQLVVEIFFESLHLICKDDALIELSLMYPSMNKSFLFCIYLFASCGEMIFTVAYLGIGVLASISGRPRGYSRCAKVALTGTLAQLALAYINRFNLLIFFLRFITYAYARFLGNLLTGIYLLRGEFAI